MFVTEWRVKRWGENIFRLRGSQFHRNFRKNRLIAFSNFSSDVALSVLSVSARCFTCTFCEVINIFRIWDN